MEHVKNPAAPNEHPARGVFALISEDRLAAAEGTFFTWLGRIMLAAVLIGSAEIDDAPPLGLGAMLIALYVAVRAVSRLSDIVAAVPFENRAAKATVGLGVLVLYFFAFAIVLIFVGRLAALVT